MVYKIADLYIDIYGSCDYIYSYCEKFLCKDYPRIDFKVEVTREEAFSELPNGIVPLASTQMERVHAELNAIYRKICSRALEYDAFLMHGALIEYEGRGYLFTAQSGTGKTTHINLWKKAFGEDKVTVINGDKPILRFIDGKLYAYGTPWSGKEGYYTTDRVELNALCFVKRNKDNCIQRVNDTEVLPLIFSQIMLTDSANLEKQLELVDRMLQKVSLHVLRCNMDVEAAHVAYNGMKS